MNTVINSGEDNRQYFQHMSCTNKMTSTVGTDLRVQDEPTGEKHKKMLTLTTDKLDMSSYKNEKVKCNCRLHENDRFKSDKCTREIINCEQNRNQIYFCNCKLHENDRLKSDKCTREVINCEQNRSNAYFCDNNNERLPCVIKSNKCPAVSSNDNDKVWKQQTEESYTDSDKNVVRCILQPYWCLLLLIAIAFLVAIVTLSVICTVLYMNNADLNELTTRSQIMQADAVTVDRNRENRQGDVVQFHLDVFDKRLDDDDEADLTKSKWTNIKNSCVDFNGHNNSFVVKKSGLYFISLSLNVIANIHSKLVTKSLICIHYHNGFRDVCKRVMLLPGIEIPIYIQTINFMRPSETFWISIKNKDILYRSASMNTLTVWRM